MYPAQGTHEIMTRIGEMDKFLEIYFDKNSDDSEIWIKSYDDEIESLLRGLKKLCFDCGELSKYKKYQDDINWTWKKVKKKHIKEEEYEQ